MLKEKECEKRVNKVRISFLKTFRKYFRDSGYAPNNA